jgi:phosphatidylserine/phosphatidylglycerophosphate/cardiolipin synthase-like enzyme
MHHKFVVLDRVEVWTGSMNLTINGAYRNDNNLLRIRSREIAENYLREFEEMYIQKRFGSASLSDTPHPSVNLEGIEIETYFSPDDGVIYKIIDLINGASHSLDLLAFAITSDPISNAFLAAEQRDIEVRGVVEASQISGMGSDVSTLRAAGMDIRLDGNSNLMHHKVLIIDSRIVLLGSYNFTRSAEEKNDENTLIVYDPALAEQFLIEFDRLYTSARE